MSGGVARIRQAREEFTTTTASQCWVTDSPGFIYFCGNRTGGAMFRPTGETGEPRPAALSENEHDSAKFELRDSGINPLASAKIEKNRDSGF